jgi:hypothetical protein
VFKIAVAPQARTQRLAPKGARNPLIACGAFGFCFPASQKSFYRPQKLGLRKLVRSPIISGKFLVGKIQDLIDADKPS